MRTRSSSQLPEAGLNQFEHIKLSTEEELEALRLMREVKHFKQIREQYVEKMYAEEKPKIFTAEEMIEAYGKHFDIDDENREEINKIAYYFAGDGRFPGDLKKGIWLFGNVGVGKTSLLGFFSNNQRRNFEVMPCRTVEKLYADKGNPGIKRFYHPEGNAETRRGWLFDDIGTEETLTKFYGTPKAVMAEVILDRYDNGFEFDETHMTTNLTSDQVLSRYGSRVFDRLPEMFNFIEFTSSKSRRV